MARGKIMVTAVVEKAVRMMRCEVEGNKIVRPREGDEERSALQRGSGPANVNKDDVCVYLKSSSRERTDCSRRPILGRKVPPRHVLFAPWKQARKLEIRRHEAVGNPWFGLCRFFSGTYSLLQLTERSIVR